MKFVARAPGRLDVMGGIADYSGATVLELPLACATTATVEPRSEPRFDLATRRAEGPRRVSLRPDTLASRAALLDWLGEHRADAWVGYVAGAIQWCLEEARRRGRVVPPGLSVAIESTVPEGRGVASSAALEVAVASATAACYELDVPREDLAAACQSVENRVVGAPCGIMDQMTSALGRADRLLRLRCQPGTVEGYVAVPRGLRFFGIDSGIAHAVTGADYRTVRTAAFMGLRMLAERAGPTAAQRWSGFLANVTPDELATLGADLPDEMSGDAFLRRFRGIADTATTVLPERRYPVRAATRHPVGEQRRVMEFAALLGEVDASPGAALRLGELMYQAHASYGSCGLGSDGTDRLVDLVREAGAPLGLFGAKITGGGSGGTVAVLAAAHAGPHVRAVAERYRAETGRDVTVFDESGPGLELARLG